MGYPLLAQFVEESSLLDISSRYIGLAKTHLQHVLTSVAMNITRIVSWLMGISHAHTRISRFAALAANNELVSTPNSM